MISYMVEYLYHFSCHECRGWWTVADFHRCTPEEQKTTTCPHCKHTSTIHRDYDGEIDDENIN